MALARTVIAEPGGVPYAPLAKVAIYLGRCLGRARTMSGAAMLANEYGASVRVNSPHDGRHVVIEGPDRFSVEDRV